MKQYQVTAQQNTGNFVANRYFIKKETAFHFAEKMLQTHKAKYVVVIDHINGFAWRRSEFGNWYGHDRPSALENILMTLATQNDDEN